jgi:hypothetical protein
MKVSKKLLLLVMLCIGMILTQGCGLADKFFGKTDYDVQSFDQGWKSLDFKGLYSIQYPDYLVVKNPDEITLNTLKKGSASSNFDYLKNSGRKGMLILGTKENTDFAQIKILAGFPNKVPKLFDNVRLTPAQLVEYNITFENNVKAKNAQQGINGKRPVDIKYPVWNKVKIEYVNGINCLAHSYEMQQGDGPIIMNHSYTYFNKDVVYTVMITESKKHFEKHQDIKLLDAIKTFKIVPRN